MRIKSKLAIVSYRLLFVILAITGIYLNLSVKGTINFGQLRYYTLLSNVLCLIYMLACLVKNCINYRSWDTSDQRQNVVFMKSKGAITLAILVTFLVFHFLLSGSGFSMGPAGSTPDLGAYSSSLSNRLVHYVIPVMFLLDWLLFDVKGTIEKYDPLSWVVIPYAYFIYVLIRAQLGGPVFIGEKYYPYFFIDVDLLGWGGVLRYVILITVFFIALGYVIFMIDNYLGKKAKDNKHY